MNYTFEDLENPTIVKNSFSRQITLQGTKKNNQIFGAMYRLDRKNAEQFNASRKTPFTIYNEMSEIVESGYMKLDKVAKVGSSYEYTITLFGGLGSFFYALMYKEDGEKKTLADLRYKMLNGSFTSAAGHFGQVGGYEMLHDAWLYLANPEGYSIEDHDCWWPNIVNFAPAYNGKPDKFSADKALVDSSSFYNMPTLYRQTGASSNLMVFTNDHTEWELKELRWYLQRPVVSIKALFDAICDNENNGGWNVEVSQSLFENDILSNAWLTLPLIPKDKRKSADAIVGLMASTKSPAEYMISFAKILGLVFFCDSSNKAIRIMPRSEFFSSAELIDLTGRIDSKNVGISPVLAQSHYYQFGNDAIGEWAALYKEDFGRPYGIQKVNTGNEFNEDTTIVTDGILYKEAVELQERNRMFVSEYHIAEGLTKGIDIFRLPGYERVYVENWKNGEMLESEVPYDGTGSWFYDNVYYRYSDWLPKVQLHEADNKAVDASDVILLFNGVKATPVFRDWAQLEYRLTDDHPDMSALNDDTPCWNFTNTNSRKITKLPSFRRCLTIGDMESEEITATMEWGEPLARGVNGVTHPADPVTIYNRWWRNYQRDRYDDDTFSMTCKTNLSGMRVGQELMRNFFYYDGAIFMLNKITNHSLTTMDDTECEFIKVQDINNYKS
jgi:hypothetical protein